MDNYVETERSLYAELEVNISMVSVTSQGLLITRTGI